MSDALADKMKAAREVLIGLNATDEQMNALADVFDFGSDTIEALRAENARLLAALRPFATAKVNRIFPQSPIFHLNYSEQDGDPFENAIAAMGDNDG